MTHAGRFVGADGTAFRALQFDGRVAGFVALLGAFPGRIAPHPHRDDAVLVKQLGGGCTRIEADDWVVEQPDGSLRTYPDDQFRILFPQPKALAA